MRFRISFAVRRLTLANHEVDPVILKVQRAHDLTVVLTSTGPDSQPLDHLSCTAETTLEPPAAVVEAFRHLVEGQLPPNHLPRDQWSRPHDEVVDAGGKIVGGHILPLYVMPESFRNFAGELSAELHEAAEATVGLLRWRSRTIGPRNPFSSQGLEYSTDGDLWKHMPVNTSAHLGDVAHIDVTPAAASQLQELLDSDEREPLAHSLFREAWSQRRDNPASSLLIGMAALEVGVKHYIAACVPAATWLAENVPSPPIVKMIEQYLPTLEPPAGGSPMAPVDLDVIATLKIAVTKRNELAHRGVEMSGDRLVKTLRAIRNVLWTLDIARGHTWATDYLSSLDEDLSVGYRRI